MISPILGAPSFQNERIASKNAERLCLSKRSNAVYLGETGGVSIVILVKTNSIT